MGDIVQFLRDRLDEDQATADAAAKEKPAPWREHYGDVLDATGAELIGSVGYGGAIVPPYVDEHIARQDPARTLRQVAAQRAIVDWCAEIADMDYVTRYIGIQPGDDTELAAWMLMKLAEQWSDHPDFDPSWSVDRG